MQTWVIGFIAASGILAATFMHSKVKLTTFLNPEGIIIVIGGTFAILMMTAKRNELLLLLRMMGRLFRKPEHEGRLKSILLDCSRSIESGKIPQETGHPFLDKSLGWLSAGLRGPVLDKLLVDGAKLEVEQAYQTAQVLGNLAKYPPALGMIGTVFGIIGIFNGLGTAEGQRSIGVNLSFAMTATLYGLVFANFCLSPISELLMQIARQQELEIAMIVETAKLWSERESSFFIQEHVELYHVA